MLGGFMRMSSLMKLALGLGGGGGGGGGAWLGFGLGNSLLSSDMSCGLPLWLKNGLERSAKSRSCFSAEVSNGFGLD